ncbi:hypothetical protein C8R45DRAFT_1108227 [Mycena sanguinolenta]|nr:hypothetical protein C8R45DRAFT_1108227 [Mycena sanguinolenta]
MRCLFAGERVRPPSSAPPLGSPSSSQAPSRSRSRSLFLRAPFQCPSARGEDPGPAASGIDLHKPLHLQLVRKVMRAPGEEGSRWYAEEALPHLPVHQKLDSTSLAPHLRPRLLQLSKRSLGERDEFKCEGLRESVLSSSTIRYLESVTGGTALLVDWLAQMDCSALHIPSRGPGTRLPAYPRRTRDVDYGFVPINPLKAQKAAH